MIVMREKDLVRCRFNFAMFVPDPSPRRLPLCGERAAAQDSHRTMRLLVLRRGGCLPENSASAPAPQDDKEMLKF